MATEIASIYLKADVGDLNKGEVALKGFEEAADDAGQAAEDFGAAAGAAGKRVGNEIPAATGKASAGLQKFEADAKRAGQSVGQYANNMRMVPAQITDIATQLAGGQSPLLILMQQGGQLRDMFGSIPEAMRATANSAMGLLKGAMNPLTLGIIATVGTIGSMGYAYYKASQQSAAFNRTLIMTGNTAGLTRAELERMAYALTGANSFTKAGDALNQFVNAGVGLNGNLKELTASALKFSDSFDIPIDEVVKQFKDLGGDPVNTLQKLAATSGEFSQSQVAAVKALKDSGDAAGAAALAQKYLAQSMDGMSQKAEQELTPIGRILRSISNAANDATGAIMHLFQGADNAGKLADSMAELQKIENAQSKGQTFSSVYVDNLKAQINLLSKATNLNLNLNGAIAKGNQERKAAASSQMAWDAITSKYQSNATQRADELKQLETAKRNKQNAKTWGADDEKAYQEARAAIAKRYADPKDPKAKKSPAVTVGAGDTELMSLKAQAAAVANQRQLMLSTGNAQQKVTELSKVEAKIRETIAYGQTNQLSIQQKSLLANQDAIKQAANELDIQNSLLESDKKRLELRKQANDAAAKMDQDTAAIRSTAGMGSQAREEALARGRIAAQYADDYKARETALDAYNRKLAASREAEADWSNGFSSAWDDFKAQSQDVAGVVSSSMGNMFDSATSSLHKFVTTGKASFKDFASSILDEIAKIGERMAISGLIGMFGSMFGGDGAAANSSFSGGAYNGLSFAAGGFTGAGGKYEPAGVVHRGEFVMPQEAVNRIGVDNLNALMRKTRGYAAGGLVGGGSSVGRGSANGGGLNITVPVTIEGGNSANPNAQDAMGVAYQRVITQAVKDGIQREKQQGGKLWGGRFNSR